VPGRLPMFRDYFETGHESDARTHRTPKALRAKLYVGVILFRPASAGLSECARVLASLFAPSHSVDLLFCIFTVTSC
jgi:hypothetical protein